VYRKLCISIIVFVFLFPVFSPFIKVAKAASVPKLRVLEITDVEKKSTLSDVLSSDSYEIVTMPIKRFVASREDLDGKYDAIYFANGTYSTDFPRLDPNPNPTNPADQNKILTSQSQRKAENQTVNKMNDLTLLKAKEIEDNFINKNLPVIADESILGQTANSLQIVGRKSVLKDLFTKYKNMKKSNVYFIKSVSEFPKVSALRPRMSLLTKPSEYSGSSQDTIYKPKDTLEFSFQVYNGDTNQIKANLYIDTNFNNKFEATERISSYALNDIKEKEGYKLTYTLPRGYSGVRMWKLEITDNKDLKDYTTGMFRFRDEKVTIQVLQVTNGGSGNLLNTLTSIPKNGNVIETEDYKITIDVTDLLSFQKDTEPLNYKQLSSGKYNMVIFGFKDSYGNTRITNTEAQKALETFIQTGQSVFMTHDTLQRIGSPVLEDTNSWIKSFMPYAGQNYETGVSADYQTKSMNDKVLKPGNYFLETNLGFQAVLTVYNIKKVNNGLITSYPYFLGDNVDVATTHSQYFALNLEDPDVIPWYNLSGSGLDNNDSYNHFYIYSRKNITYTGAGHSSSGFKPAEQQLFLNTMYTSFASANHAPLITIDSPAENDKILSNQKLNTSFKVEDLDAKDRVINVKVYINDKSVYEGQVNNGATVTQAFEHGLADGGTATIRVEASDELNAKTVKTVNITVQKAQTNVTATREWETSGAAKVNNAVNIHYHIKPEDLNITGIGTSPQIKVTGLRPFTLWNFYSWFLNLGVPMYYPDFNFVNSYLWPLRLTGSIDSDVKKGYPQSISIDELNMLFNSKKIDWDTQRTNEYIKALQEYVDSTYSSILTIPIYSVLYNQFIQFGRFKVDKLLSGGVNITFLGYVRNYSLSIENMQFEETFPEGLDVKVPDDSIFKKSTNSNGETVVKANLGDLPYSSSTTNPNLFSAEGIDFTIAVTPKEKGTYTLNKSGITFNGIDGNLSSINFETLQLTAKDGLESVNIPDTLELNIDSQPQNILLSLKPDNVLEQGVIQSIKWSVQNGQDVVSVDPKTGVVTPRGPGQAVVKVTVQDIFGTVKEDTVNIIVRVPVENIQMKDEITMLVNETANLNLIVTPPEVRNTLKWDLGDSKIVSVDTQNGEVKGISPGITVISVTGLDKDKNPIVRQTKVTVLPRVSKITVVPNPLEMVEGQTYQFQNANMAIEPTEAGNKNMKWSVKSILDAPYISVTEDGLIIAKAATPSLQPATAVVTAQDGSGVSAEVKVIVKSAYQPLQGVSFASPSITIKVGETKDLYPLLIFLPNDATNKKMELWSTSDKRFATVSSSGTVAGVSKGYATVTAVSEDGKKTAKILVNVIEQGSGGTLPDSGIPIFRW
jgi:uncharacterized protein YjdB